MGTQISKAVYLFIVFTYLMVPIRERFSLWLTLEEDREHFSLCCGCPCPPQLHHSFLGAFSCHSSHTHKHTPPCSVLPQTLMTFLPERLICIFPRPSRKDGCYTLKVACFLYIFLSCVSMLVKLGMERWWYWLRITL